MPPEPSIPPVVKTLVVPCAPAKAFHYFTAEIHHWWPAHRFSVTAGQSQSKEKPVAILFEPRAGGRIFERSPAGTEHLWGTVRLWQPPERVSFSFHPGRDATHAQTVDVSFSPVPEGTRVVLVHAGWDNLGPDAGATRDEYNGGWEAVFMTCFRDFAASRSAAPAAEPEVRVAILHRPGPKWNPALPFRDQPGLGAHVGHYHGMLETGKLFIGGPFLDGAGGMMISAPGVSLPETKAFAEADPAVQSGLLLVEIHPWLIGLRASL